MLTEIRHYLQRCRRATLADIARHLETDPAAVQGMLEHWLRKGKVGKTRATSSCGSACTRCDQATVEIYEWLDEGDPGHARAEPPPPGGCPPG
jgi:putative ferrous iron transport protein C